MDGIRVLATMSGHIYIYNQNEKWNYFFLCCRCECVGFVHRNEICVLCLKNCTF